MQYLNDRFYRMIGIRREERAQFIKANFFGRFDRELIFNDFAKGDTKLSIEYPIIYADGTRHWRDGLLFIL